MAPTVEAARHRLDIQALRAAAVLAVLLNHLWPLRLTGGFIGVDIFFVISGFLISRSLIEQLETSGRISLARFYARRAARLIPAAFMVTVFSLAMALFFSPSREWARIAWEAFASAAYVENIALMVSQTDYFTRDTPPTPFQHYWSLSVEEQFYLVWPVLLVGVYVLARKVRAPRGIAARPASGGHGGHISRIVGAALCLVIAASLAFSQAQVIAEPEAAYFHPLGRVWEFAVGALVALAVVRGCVSGILERVPGAFVAAFQMAAWGVLAACVVAYGERLPFPGLTALPPVLATAAVIALGPATHFGLARRVVESRLVQRVGDSSYSVYLWHWPLITFAPSVLVRPLTTLDKVGLAVLSLALGWFSYRVIERPARVRLVRRAPLRASFAVALAALAIVAAGSGLFHGYATSYEAQRAADREAALAALQQGECFGVEALREGAPCESPMTILPVSVDPDSPWRGYPSECTDVRKEPAPRGGQIRETICDFGGGRQSRDVVVFGDSHVEHIMHGLFPLARENGWSLTLVTHSGCSATSALDSSADAPANDAERSCAKWARESIARFGREEPDHLIVAAAAESQSLLRDPGASAQAFLTELESRAPHATVTVLRDVPLAGYELGPWCLQLLRGDSNTCLRSEGEVLMPDPLAEAAKATMRESGGRVSLTDLSRYVCRDGECSGVVGGVPVYFDDDHLSRSFAESLAPVFARDLSRAWGVRVAEPAA